ncbi:MAG: Npt1/Npt2 family nucleotide transporter, partial [Gemmatimonadota bacterium]|nr:Npt1/Npt2 family nucleotide transporter [Gemmatimonadota bacterium]
MRERLADWLGIRPHEVRVVALSAGGAFLAIAFAVLARSLREALYLTSFPVSSLPYIIAAVAVLSIPVVTWFARALSGKDPRRVLVRVLAGLGAGIALLWPLVSRSSPAVVVFYVWTDIGTLLVTSGFWLVAAELFPVRGAKRLYGLIGAGGTAGAMVGGNAVALLSSRVGFGALLPGLVLLLGLFWLVQRRLPSRTAPPSSEPESRPSLREGWRSAWGHPHLRTIGAIVAVATVASTLVDYQFKEAARAVVGSGEPLAGFFGAFYGWAGAASLFLQLFVT